MKKRKYPTRNEKIYLSALARMVKLLEKLVCRATQL